VVKLSQVVGVFPTVRRISEDLKEKELDCNYLYTVSELQSIKETSNFANDFKKKEKLDSELPN
jgi:hypothetical protein